MKFRCVNLECRKFHKEEEYYKNSIKMINGRLMSENAICPSCGYVREEVTENMPLSEKNISIGKYSSASPEQKKEMLKKRSHDHFQKEVKPYKEHKLNEAVNHFNNASKK